MTEMKDSIASKSFVDARVHEQRSIVRFAGERTLFTDRQPKSVQINYHNRAKMVNAANLPSLNGSLPSNNKSEVMENTLDSYLTTYKKNYEQPSTGP